ncbi:rod shape-determining protein MreD [Thalassospiraceae bacterium LMO-JJ14]|nr:rod shape-determining protein MreD [Thalassospiraceae bacterium LMO-JJ14]
MKPSFWHRVDRFARDLTPFALTFVLLVIGAIPFHIPGFAQVAPMLPLIGIYFWAVYRPDLMPAAAVFLIGIIHDFLSGLPVGVSALIFLLVLGAALAQRSFFSGKSFVIVWIGFVFVAAGALALEWLLLSIVTGELIQARSAIYQFGLTVAVFPVLSWMFTRWQQAFLQTS